MTKIEVNAGSVSYPYRVGDRFLNLEELIKENGKAERTGLVISQRVYDLHREYIESTLPSQQSCDIFCMQDDEENKSYSHAEGFLQGLVKKGYGRNSLLIGIGGGVVGDFTGFLAAVYMRGISVIHVPTTLLSMVDSSIGGKVAVNLNVGKNIVGAFHQPSAVASDVSFLDTLPDEEWQNGLAEIVKHGLIGDSATLNCLERISPADLKKKDVIMELIGASAAFKAGVVEKDEKESGLRAILNFGHTVGHGLESLLEFTGISHGEAVAAGMVAATEMSRRTGLLPDSEAEGIFSLMERFLPRQYNYDFSARDILDHMKYDKKNKGGEINFVLLQGIGLPLIDKKVNENIILESLKLILKQ